jgi:hypothetical protein
VENPGNYKIPEGSNLISDAQLRAAQLLYQLNRFEDASKAYLAYVKDHPEGEAAAKLVTVRPGRNISVKTMRARWKSLAPSSGIASAELLAGSYF